MVERDEKEIMRKWVEGETPLLSICCPTFNHEEYLCEALDSFLMQETNFPFEIIVRDDCSTDQTASIVRSYVKKYPHLIKPIYESENQYSKGINPFNTCLKHVQGKYIALCEGDDYWQDAEKLQKQIDFLDKNKNYVVTYHNACVIDEKGNLLKELMFNDSDDLDYTANELMMFQYMPTMSLVFRNVISELPDEFNNVVNGDAFLISLLGNYGHAKFIKSILPSTYRTHSGGVWSQIAKEKKHLNLVVTYYWIATYYKRIGKDDIASKWSCISMEEIDKGVGIRKSTLFKWFLLNHIDRERKFKRFIKKMFNTN